MNALFYSKYCSSCQELINELGKSELYDKLEFICVDIRNHKKDGKLISEAVQVNQLISKYKIEKVPTIVMGNKKATGTNAFNIIKQFSNSKPSVPEEKTVTNKSSENKGDPKGISGELFGYSDDYAFLGNDNVPQEKAFNYLNNEKEEIQEMINVDESSHQINQDVNNNFEKMMSDRNNFDNSRSIKRN